MARDYIELRYYETYYHVSAVHDVLRSPQLYLRNLNNWHESKTPSLFSTPFPKWSLLHDLAYFVIGEIIFEQSSEGPLESIAKSNRSALWVDEALEFHGFPTDGFASWLQATSRSISTASLEDIHDYHLYLSDDGDLENLIEHLSHEVFYVLFTNRGTLESLNRYAAGILADYFESADSAGAALERVAIPVWCKRAVFFRDRGMCASCKADLGGVLSSQPDCHYDHIVPLASGGINDVTNLQLLCSNCNLTKGSKPLPSSRHYQVWYPFE